MNSKAAKRLRRRLREEVGKDWRERYYRTVEHPPRDIWVPGRGRVQIKRTSLRLNLTSGRGLYRAMKQHDKRSA
jgi:hypothetical protein